MSEKELLNIKDLVVDVEEKEILHGVNLTIRPGETHVLMGPNGTGKSTLGYTLLGNPRYTVKQGEIWFDGKISPQNRLMSVQRQASFYLSRIRWKCRV